MSVTRIESIFRVRDLLDSPLPQSPSFHQLLRQQISEEMDVVNQLNNTGRAWGTAEYQLNYTPSQTTYTIGVENFGKVLFVVKQTGNPYIPYVPVPFNDITEQDYGTILTSFYGVYGTIFPLSETPEKMSFYREGVTNAQYKVSIQPAPAVSWTYIVTFLPGYIGTGDALETAVQMPEHAELIRMRAAMALLNYSRWGVDEAFNRQKRMDLMQGFQYQLERKERLFSKYIQSINIPRQVEIEPWSGSGY